MQIQLTKPCAATDRAEKLTAGDWKARVKALEDHGRGVLLQTKWACNKRMHGDGAAQTWEKSSCLLVPFLLIATNHWFSSLSSSSFILLIVPMQTRLSIADPIEDEARVLWLLHCHAEAWQKEWAEADGAAGAPTTRKPKKTGPHVSSLGLKIFVEMLDTVLEVRADVAVITPPVDIPYRQSFLVWAD